MDKEIKEKIKIELDHIKYHIEQINKLLKEDEEKEK